MDDPPANPPDSWILYQATLHYVAGEVWVWAKQINGPKKETIYIANGHAICQPEANLQPLKAILQPSLSHHSSIPSRSQISLANSRPLQWLVIPLTNGIQNAPNSASVPILKRSYTPNSQHFHSENDDLLSNLGLRVASQTKPLWWCSVAVPAVPASADWWSLTSPLQMGSSNSTAEGTARRLRDLMDTLGEHPGHLALK